MIKVDKKISNEMFNIPCDLFMDIAKQGRTGNWSRLKLKGRSLGIMGILGMNTSSPADSPVSIVASITCGIRFFTTNLVPLQSFGGSRFLSSIIGAPILSVRL